MKVPEVDYRFRFLFYLNEFEFLIEYEIDFLNDLNVDLRLNDLALITRVKFILI